MLEAIFCCLLLFALLPEEPYIKGEFIHNYFKTNQKTNEQKNLNQCSLLKSSLRETAAENVNQFPVILHRDSAGKSGALKNNVYKVGLDIH